MEADDSRDTAINRLAELERLVQIQKEEIRRIAHERDLLAAWYGATEARRDACNRQAAHDAGYAGDAREEGVLIPG